MKRGEVWCVSFDPALRGEIRKTRPVNRLQVLPLSTKTARFTPARPDVTLNGELSNAMADQITTVLKHPLRERMGCLPREDFASVERVIRLQLGMA
jgi:mRNA interferase MazF